MEFHLWVRKKTDLVCYCVKIIDVNYKIIEIFCLHNLLNSEFTLLSFLSERLKSTKRGNKEVKIILASVLLLIL